MSVVLYISGDDVSLHTIAPSRSQAAWRVWLNPSDEQFEGLCLGLGATRALAVEQAKQTLENCIAALSDGKAVSA